MKAIILNSGMGSRLKDLTKNNPKSLVKISEKETIFSRAIKILSQFEINEFIITTGYLNNVLEDYARDIFPEINFNFVYNSIYNKTNYIKSLNLIKEEINEDIILLHGDLIFSKEVAQKIINSEKTSVVVDSSQNLSEKDFKAKIDNNQVKLISVNYIGEDAVACQPFYKLKAHDWNLWKSEIDNFCNKNKTNVYAEEALNNITNNLILNPLDIKGELCCEIDTVEDLNKVKELLK